MAKKTDTKTSTSTTKVDESRRDFLSTVTTTFGAAGAACAAYPLIKQMSPSDDVKAQATTEVNLSEIPLGESKIVMWQGKPVFIKHRTASEIEEARAGDATATIDPQKDEDRVQKAQWLVTLGVCTHLGCVPNSGGNHEGWLCPCHGSQFDSSGRVRVGPAPTNLEVPPYTFLDDNTIKIG